MDSTLACLAAWMPRQRWYASKGRSPSLRLVAWWDLPSSDDDAIVRTFLVADEGALPVVIYQIPVVARATADVEASPEHIIGSPEPGTTFIDGPFDPAYAQALLRLVTRGGEGSGPGAVAVGAPTHRRASDAVASSRVLAGEQSNTSLIYEIDSGMPIICKVFRQVHAGLNPDIELQTALADAGSSHVPKAIGSVEGTWPDASSRGTISGSLAFAQEFLPGVEDAWRVALHAASAGEDFTARARDLGAATADVHLDLAQLFPTLATGPSERDTIAATWRRRLAIAIAEVPAIADRRDSIEEVYERALDVEWPPLQRIHGDYHLGQVLHSSDRGWMLLDFEGEPLRPMSERRDPDLALRDVAGMLRSIDYVAGSIRLDHPDRSPEDVLAWSRVARQAFLDGYAHVADVDLERDRPLLAALELDKAVYESIYETRNRPTWVAIPLRAIARLAGQPTPAP